MPDATDAGPLPAEQWEQLVALPDRLEAAWASGGPVELAQFLPAVDDSLRLVALREVVRADLAIRYRRGQPIRLEAYRKMFPELAEPGAVSPRLILEEYRARRRRGEAPALEEYRSRFPEQFAEAERLIQEDENAFATYHPTAPSSDSPIAATPPPPGGVRRPDPDAVTEAFRSEGEKAAAGKIRAARGSATAMALTDLVRETIGYELSEHIGRGSFAEVWRARAPGQVEVAVKIILQPVSDEQAVRELDSLERIKDLRHPYLLRSHAFWLIEGRLVIAMELADRSLQARQAECRKTGLTGVPLDELLMYTREAAEAIDFLHRNLVHHGDIKPANILLTGGHVQVADFGLARVLASEHSITASGSGTPAYMAPEVCRGRFSPHSDQYSLAATYVELRLGRKMFEVHTSAEVILAHLSREPDLRGLPAPEQQVLLRALSKEPTARYANCLAFADALYRAAGREPRGFVPRQAASPRQGAAPPQAPAGAAGEATELVSDVSRAPAPTPAPAPQPVRSSMRRFALLLLLLTLGFAGFVVWFVFFQGRTMLIPAGWERAPGSALVTVREGNWRQRLVGVDYPARISRTTPLGRLELALVTPARPAMPFYVMPQRVTNAEFLSFVEARPDRVRAAWQPEGELVRKAAQAPDEPVMGLAWGEANACANWAGGKLPSLDQLKAAYSSGVCQDALLADAEEWSDPNPRPDLRGGLRDATFRIVVPAPRTP